MRNPHFDFAFCPLGHRSAVRPTMPESSNDRPQSSMKDDYQVFVRCRKCNRIYSFGTLFLVPMSEDLVGDHQDPDYPTRVFQVSIECAEPDCGTRITVFATLSADTTAAQIEEQKMTWESWPGLPCPSGKGHLFRWPSA